MYKRDKITDSFEWQLHIKPHGGFDRQRISLLDAFSIIADIYPVTTVFANVLMQSISERLHMPLALAFMGF